ncbi:MAG: hypothetical protein H7138_15480 [Myxococcales bacterium]|nr:hypothetical protein [Myxococcales bacterium]
MDGEGVRTNTKFGIGNVLVTGFRIWAKNVIPFLFLTALIYAPVLLWNLGLLQGEMTDARIGALIQALEYSSRLMIVLNIVVSAALTYGVVMDLRGQRVSIGACIVAGLARFFPVIGVCFLSAVCVIAGTIVLLIPGLIVFCMLYVSSQVAVFERPGVIGALKRSRDLTDGHKLEILGLLVLLGLVSWGLQWLIDSVMFSSFEAADRIHIARYVYVLLTEEVILGSIASVMPGVAYYFLRIEKEGVTAAQLAAALD